MANWTNLKDSIAKVIKTNGNQEITGEILQQTLLSIVDNVGNNAQFKGVAIPSTVPTEQDGNTFYLASTQGTYPNFANLEVGESEIAVFVNKTEDTWEKLSLPIKTGSDIKVPLLKGGNVTATPTGSGVVLSVPTLQPDGSETKSNLVVNVASKTQAGVMSSAQVNNLENVKTQVNTVAQSVSSLEKKHDEDFGNIPDFVVGSNDDRDILNIDNGTGELTDELRVGISLKTKDSANGTEGEAIGYIEAFDPVASESNVSGRAGVADIALFDHIPRVFNGIADLKVGDDAGKALTPVYARQAPNDYEAVATENKFYANGPATPRAGDRIRMNTYTSTVAESPSWAIVTSVQKHGKNIWMLATFENTTYTFSYVDGTYLVNTAWAELSQGKYIYDADALLSLTSASAAADLRDALKPMGASVYRIPKTGDLLLLNGKIGELSLRVVESSDTNVLYISKTNGETIEATINADGFSGWTVSEESKPMRYAYEYVLMLLTGASTEEAAIRQALTPMEIVIQGSEAYTFATTQPRLPQTGDVLVGVKDGSVSGKVICADNSSDKDWMAFSVMAVSPDNSGQPTYPLLLAATIKKDFSDIKGTFYGSLLDAQTLATITSVGTLRDLYIQAGAKYNEDTGYYELNGLTDITEEEMREIYLRTNNWWNALPDMRGWYDGGKCRTNIPCPSYLRLSYTLPWNLAQSFNGDTKLEVINFNPRTEVASFQNRTLSGIDYFLQGNRSTKKVIGKLVVSSCPAISIGGYALEDISLFGINKNVNLYQATALSKESLLYMINNSTATSAITIFLLQVLYDKYKADTDVLAALEEHPFVSLALKTN